MVQPALGPSLGVAPCGEQQVCGCVGAQKRATGAGGGWGAADLGHVQVDVRGDQEVVVQVPLHQEGACKGVRDAGTLPHHLAQLPGHLQRAVLLLPVLPGPGPRPPQRGLDKQRGAPWGGAGP